MSDPFAPSPYVPRYVLIQAVLDVDRQGAREVEGHLFDGVGHRGARVVPRVADERLGSLAVEDYMAASAGCAETAVLQDVLLKSHWTPPPVRPASPRPLRACPTALRASVWQR